MNIHDHNAHIKSLYNKCKNAINTPEFFILCEEFYLNFRNFVETHSNVYDVLEYTDEDMEMLELQNYLIKYPYPVRDKSGTGSLMQLLQYGVQDIAIIGNINNMDINRNDGSK